jgi:iron complex transport system substrate-binding protein
VSTPKEARKPQPEDYLDELTGIDALPTTNDQGPTTAPMTDHTPRRIVSLQPSASVILENLGALDRLVGCTKYCVDLYPDIAHGRVIVDDSWTASAAQIVATKPDLVIAAVPYQEKAVSEILKSGARFLGLAPRTLADIYTDIVLIAGTIGLSVRGEAIVSEMQTGIERVRSLTCNLPRPRVFCEEWGKPIIASQPWVAELVEAAGGESVAEAGMQTSEEAIRALDPDVFIAAWCGAGDRVPLARIIRARGWGELKAVRENRIYCIRDEYLNTPAPTLLSGLHALAAAIHPDPFSSPAGLRCISDESSEPRSLDSSVV